jgi:hypothetical protein
MMTLKEKQDRLDAIRAGFADGSYSIFQCVIEARKIGESLGEVADAVIDSWGGVPPELDGGVQSGSEAVSMV